MWSDIHILGLLLGYGAMCDEDFCKPQSGKRVPIGEGCISYCFKVRQGDIIKHDLRKLKAVPEREDSIGRREFSQCFNGLIQEFTCWGNLISVVMPLISVPLLYDNGCLGSFKWICGGKQKMPPDPASTPSAATLFENVCLSSRP